MMIDKQMIEGNDIEYTLFYQMIIRFLCSIPFFIESIVALHDCLFVFFRIIALLSNQVR